MIFYNANITPFVGYSNDSGNTIVRDTFIDIINSINYMEIENGEGFYIASTPSGTFINSNSDKNWTKIDKMNFRNNSFYSRKTGFAIENSSNLNTLKIFNYSNEFNIGINRNAISQNTISIYPNPTQNILNIQANEALLKNNTNVQVINANGQLFTVKLNNSQIDISHLAQGFYCLIINSENENYMLNFVKE
jgi:hypothetical protein